MSSPNDMGNTKGEKKADAIDQTRGAHKEALKSTGDLKRMMDMKKQYEQWQKAMFHRMGSGGPNTSKEGSGGSYLPFPKEKKKSDVYLDAVRTLQMKEAEHYRNEQVRSRMDDPNKGPPLLSDEELKFLRSKITEFITFSGLDQLAIDSVLQPLPRQPKENAFSLYGTNDEAGLFENGSHIENFQDTDQDHEHGEDQDDYDIDELSNQRFSYEYGPAHRIEVELNDGLMRDHPDLDNPDEPSCEFTFEYDANGKLVPTYSNVEEKLRLMDLQSHIKQTGRLVTSPSSPPLPSLQLDQRDIAHKKKKKSGKKKKSKPQQSQLGANSNQDCDPADACLFCQYEAFYGIKPVHMMRWYDQKVMKEEKHRQKVREKLENAKLRALKRQHDLKHDHGQVSRDRLPEPDENTS